MNITVNAVNDAPVNTIPVPQNTNEDTALIFSSGNGNLISIADLDAGGSPVQVTLTATNGTFTLNGTAGLSFSTGDGAGDGTMTFTGTVADINTALNGLSFAPNSNYNGAASLQITTDDQGNTGSGGALSDTETVNITVNAVNDAPVNTIPVPQSTNEDTALIFSSGNSNQISIADLDAGSSPVQVTLTATNGAVTLNGTAGLSFSTGNGTSDGTMTFTGTVADINTALNGLSFAPNSNYNGAASLQITTDDQGNTGSGGALSDTETVNITVNAVNDAPVNTIPVPQSTNEDTALIFSSGNSNQISIADLDAGSSPVQVTLTATNGAVTLNGTAGLSFSTGDGTSDGTMTFTGTVANINTALNGLSFAPPNNYNGAASLQIITDDQGNTGSGGALSDTETVNITVNAVNDAPVNTIPVPQNTNEDTALVFSSGNGNLISIADLDAGASPVQVTLTATNGAITLNGTAGLSFSTGDGTTDATMTFTGTVADINTALNGLSFAPTSNYNGAASLQITTDDQGNTGSGGALSDTETVNITVNAVNDAPVNTIPVPQSTNEDTALVFSSGNGNQISIADLDAGGSPVQVTLTATNGTISLNGTAGLSFSTGDGTGDGTMTFTGTVANINTALNGLNFAPTSNYNGAASLQITTDDQGNTGSGGALSDTETVNITVNAVNDAPVNTIPVPQSTNEDTALVFSSGNSNQISIADLDAGGSPVQVTLTATNGAITLNGIAGLSFSTGDGAADATMTFTGTVANINTALNGLSFAPTSNYNGAASLQIVTDDQGNTGSGGALSDTETVNITVNAVNDAPVNTIPVPQSTNEDTALVFSSGNGNLISIADLDAGASPVQVTLTATNGAISLNGTAGLSFSTGDGAADATMTFTGTVANINTALNGLSFAPTSNYNGAASLQITTDDQGNTGSGGALTDTETVNITVNAVNDAPVNTIPVPQSTNEDTALVFSSGNGNQISIADPDAGGSPVRATLTATNGAVTLNGTAGLIFSTGDGTGDSTMTFTGTVANINAALNGLSFTTPSNFSGAASLQITTNDQGNTGSGGALSDTETVNITVNAVNDAPSATVPGTQSSQTQLFVFSSAQGNAITLSDLDANAGAVEVTLVATNGALTLASTSGIVFIQGDGTDDSLMVIRGTLANLNAALDGLQFQASDTAAALDITVNDQGNTGAGGAMSVARHIDISQAPLTPPTTPPGGGSGGNGDAPPADGGNAASLIPPIHKPKASDTSDTARQPAARILANHVQVVILSTAVVSPTTASHDTSSELDATDIQSLAYTGLSQTFLPDVAESSPLLSGFALEERLWKDIREMNQSLETVFQSPWSYGAIAGVGAISAGYLLWCLQAGSLITSAMSSLPVWGSFDPLPVLEFWERDAKRKGQANLDDEDPFLQSEPETTLV
ncbi:MAG: hypothetical protein WD894_23370 [Pirellulales bacterium]